MILLDALDLVRPALGLLFWTTFIFLLLWVLLGKFAFRPIANALRDREKGIDDALRSAEDARKEIANLKADNDKILAEAREERARIIKESEVMGQKIIEEAKEKAKAEANKVRENATADISNQKLAAIMQVKNMIGGSTVELAEKVLRRELSDTKSQEAFVEQEMQRIKLT